MVRDMECTSSLSWEGAKQWSYMNVINLNKRIKFLKTCARYDLQVIPPAFRLPAIGEIHSGTDVRK